jgi:hypothetical protein
MQHKCVFKNVARTVNYIFLFAGWLPLFPLSDESTYRKEGVTGLIFYFSVADAKLLLLKFRDRLSI